MNIDSINNGIVIDHITAGRGMRLYNLLGLDSLDCSVALIKNVNSKKQGKKDIIKIDADILVNFDVIGFVDPNATVNIIRDGKLVEKLTISLPKTLKNVIKCKNPRCITTTEQELDHVFKLTDIENNVYRCIYCETKAEIQFFCTTKFVFLRQNATISALTQNRRYAIIFSLMTQYIVPVTDGLKWSTTWSGEVWV